MVWRYGMHAKVLTPFRKIGAFNARRAQSLMDVETNVVTVPQRATTYVFGDIHGQFYDLMQLMDDVDVTTLAKRDVQLVFLGDYVDRGAFSCEVILYLLLLKLRFSDKVVLLRGNHECESISSFYGFRNECRVKYGISAYYHFLSCFQSMPIAALLSMSRGKVFCVHGGLSPKLKTIDEIQVIDRRREIPTTGLFCDLLWADPATVSQNVDEKVVIEPMWEPNQTRGCSYYFNAAATFEFLTCNNLLSFIRAHEYEDEGYKFHYNDEMYQTLDTRGNKSMPPLITVFSAPNYCDSYGNTAAYLLFKDEPWSWDIQQLVSAGHPAPPIPSAERGLDMWRLFNQTLPFLPASKEFFEEVLCLAEGLKVQSGKLNKQRYRKNDGAVVGEENDNPADRRRRLTSEMHPQALRKVLDDEGIKWKSVKENSTSAAPSRIHRNLAITNMEIPEVDERSNLLTLQELDTVKLMFSLMDTDGSLQLNSRKVSQFILNILGERIDMSDADAYLKALDYDKNGVVDFADILSWVAVIKANHNNCDFNSSLVGWASVQNGIRTLAQKVKLGNLLLWLTCGCLLWDSFAPKQQKFIKSSSVRLLGSASLVLYAINILSGKREHV
ncbi:serine threonine-protein phosphatase 2b catalytic [Plasmopara halstedii]|uniref:Serine/threonine-protein phosphatase n=1 Tax=Plasmopara halstedii TaxID=4781 RepID=A0A0P1ASL9_PLAHL|nr:serine threonine-protein phosphatase 2b catalytic [Plasmopara halstedii]CEG44961.1 serine threonine-protein phosphatase 2b catalytic [Plasmopara halstedii]|eukprot:XP_024581330.1 serine threonine-protein phosphatase 2b catalytic [Plasmopara halstedii]